MKDALSPLIFPDGADTVEIFTFIAAERFRRRAEQALRALQARGLVEEPQGERVAEALAAADLAGRAVWHFSCGIFDDPAQAEAAPTRCVDQLMVALAVAGLPIRHRFRCCESRLYSSAGHVIDTSQARSLESEGGRLEICDETGRPLDPVACHGAAVALMPAVHIAPHRIEFVGRELADAHFTRNIEEELYDAAALPLARFDALLRTLRAQTPHYYLWCSTAVTSIIPVAPMATAMISGSQGSCPGQIYLSGNLSAPKTAEMLIHEASHQYFAAVEWLCALVQPGTGEQFYSPVVGRPRPLPKLLLAYHAFANVLLYMKCIVEEVEGEDHRFVESNLVKLHQDLAGLADGIDRSTTLSEEGAWLWQRMKQQVLDV